MDPIRKLRFSKQIIEYYFVFLLCRIIGEIIALIALGDIGLKADVAPDVMMLKTAELMSTRPYSVMASSLFCFWLYIQFKRKRLVIGIIPVGRLVWPSTIYGALMGAAAYVWSTFALNAHLVRTSLGIAVHGESVAAPTIADPIWMQLMVALLAAPVLEELLFRGIIFSRLRAMLVPPAAVLVQAVIFASTYSTGWPMVVAFLFGVILGAAVIHEGNWQVAAVMHCFYNLAALLTRYLLPGELVFDSAYINILLLSGALFVAAGFRFFLERRGITNDEDNAGE